MTIIEGTTHIPKSFWCSTVGDPTDWLTALYAGPPQPDTPKNSHVTATEQALIRKNLGLPE